VALLELKNVSSFYGSIQALHGVSLKVEQGEVVTLLGANGAGKSTTLRTISGLLKPGSGEIWFEGKPIHTAGPEQIVRLGISHVPEGRRIFPGLTVRENIMLGATSRGSLPRAQMAQEVEEMFAIFPDIKRFENALGWQLSGGQQQMLAVARGLMARPKLLLLDEPSAGMTHDETKELMDDILQVRDLNRNLTIVIVEHEMGLIERITDRCVVLNFGRKIAEGPYRQVAVDRQVQEAYLGVE